MSAKIRQGRKHTKARSVIVHYVLQIARIFLSEMHKIAKKFNMSAVALTDNHNMHGTVDFYKACKEEKIKPIIGCELWVANESRFIKKKSSNSFHSYPLILLVKNNEGYKNLCKFRKFSPDFILK